VCVLTGFVFISPTMFIVFIIYQEWHSVYSCICNLELWKKQIYTITDCPGKSAALCCDNACVLHCELTAAGMWYVTGEQWLQQVNDSLSSWLILVITFCLQCYYYCVLSASILASPAWQKDCWRQCECGIVKSRVLRGHEVFPQIGSDPLVM